MTSTSEWLHFHQANPSNPPPSVTATSQTTDNHFWTTGQHLSLESTVVSTTTNPPPQQLAPAEGRVSKPTRRRTRASRRTPTTLLNTDTTNFRAMVQQFTGGPATSAAAFGFGPPPQARWNPGFGLQQFQNYADHHDHQMSGGAGSSSSNLVQQGAGGGGGEVVFGNINVGLFPAGSGGSLPSENRTTNNNGSAGCSGGFQF